MPIRIIGGPRVAPWIALIVLAFAAPVAIAGDIPRVTSPLVAPLPLPYSESADAQAEVAAAIARAKAAHKFVLLDFGGNWCPDCRVAAAVLALGEIKPWVDRTFELVPVDVGRFTKNLDIAQRYGVMVKAVPTMIVLDSDGRMLNAGNPSALSDARTMTPQAIVDTIGGWIGKS